MPIFAYTIKSLAQTGNVATTNSEPLVCVDCLDVASAATLAAAAYATMATKSAGRRGLYLGRLGLEKTGFPSIWDDLSLASMLSGGMNIGIHRAFMVDFWTAWKALGSVVPDDIVLDYENGESEGAFSMTTAPCTSALIAEAASHPVLKYRLHPSFWGLTAAQITAGHGNTELTGLFDVVINTIRARALRAIVCETYQDVMGTACPRTTNYAYGNQYATTYSDFNYHFPPQNTGISGPSSPVCYIQSNNPGSGRWSGSTKARRYNGFLQALNSIRAYRDPGLPWVSSWDYNGEGIAVATNIAGWTELMRHIGRMGVSKVIQWMPLATSSDITAHESVLASVEVSSVTPGTRYAQLAVDAASVTTGDRTYTYSAGDWT